jgi:hypothetical protein
MIDDRGRMTEDIARTEPWAPPAPPKAGKKGRRRVVFPTPFVYIGDMGNSQIRGQHDASANARRGPEPLVELC